MNAPALHRQTRLRPAWRKARGLGALAALVIVVLLSGLAAAVVRLGWSSQTGMAQDVTSARALRAANSGAEWGLFQALTTGGTWTSCANATQTLDLRADTGFIVTVTCSSTLYNEGQTRDETADTTTASTVRVYTISAVACSSTTSCPDNSLAANVAYVERERLVHASSR
ncbi:MAG TPA: MSHA biogenesis protein MshP [Candidatus Aquabacterium excrementipullorum]|nr:MSHA biogenesis protein MshP [Candidatus Aquabacterium excrementipullorum]